MQLSHDLKIWQDLSDELSPKSVSTSYANQAKAILASSATLITIASTAGLIGNDNPLRVTVLLGASATAGAIAGILCLIYLYGGDREIAPGNLAEVQQWFETQIVNRYSLIDSASWLTIAQLTLLCLGAVSNQFGVSQSFAANLTYYSSHNSAEPKKIIEAEVSCTRCTRTPSHHLELTWRSPKRLFTIQGVDLV